jgi:hypothetical protein
MKVKLTLVALALTLATFFAQNASSQGVDKHFLGRWDMTLTAPGHTYPSWLDITEQNGQPAANYVGRWGNSRPLPKIEIKGNHITFVSPKEEESTKADMVFEGELKGKRIAGTITGQDGPAWSWVAVPAPVDDHAKGSADPNWAMPAQIFNGKDLTGWHMSTPDPPVTSVWTVVDGLLVSPGNGPELITDRKFQDFKLHLEFRNGPNSNSGVYLRGRYEVQIENESASEPPSHHTGGIYGFLAPNPEESRVTDEWQSFDITLVGRRVTVVQNGNTVIDNQVIPGITGGALDSDEAKPGPIYLQGSEKGHVQFRNIILTPAE